MVLGCMLSNRHAHSTAASVLESSDFFFDEHKLIFQVLRRLYREEKPAEIHLTAEELKKNDHLQAIGGVAYLTGLAQFAGTSAHIHEYIEILKAKSFNRQASLLLEEAKKAFFSDPPDPTDVAEKVHRRLHDLGKRFSNSEKTSIGEILSGAKSRIDPIPLIERIEERQQYFKIHKKPFMTGVPTGYFEIDNETTILEETNLVVVAARPAMGKTAFAINIANYVCAEKKKAVGIFSLEMGADQLVERFLSLRTGIPGEKIKRGSLSDIDMMRIKEQESFLRTAKLFIHDQNCGSITQIIAKAKTLKEEEDVSLIIVDYLQLLSGGGHTESRQYEVAEISRKLKLLAMEIKTPIMCISQLSRKVEERQGHRPMMSDLRDSGQIEQDSDVVIFIQRRDYYDPLDKPGMAELIIAKNRNGGTTPSFELHFDGKSGKFSSQLRETPRQTRPVRQPYRDEEPLFAEVGHPLLR
ncbi:MAG: Replicative helicase [Parachlamydiales bacterium]|nr:Replicative helicase [Parachlamydiales bacterium]